MPDIKNNKAHGVQNVRSHPCARGSDGPRQWLDTDVSSSPGHFQQPARGSDVVANRARNRCAASLGATPASEPEIRAFDEAIEGRRQLRPALRPYELEGDVAPVEHGIGRAEDARARVALERVDPGLVGRGIHPEADEDAIVGPLPLELGSLTRMIAMTDSIQQP